MIKTSLGMLNEVVAKAINRIHNCQHSSQIDCEKCLGRGIRWAIKQVMSLGNAQYEPGRSRENVVSSNKILNLPTNKHKIPNP